MALVELVYKLTRLFPPDEKYCLTNQMRRAAISIPSNIAEGHGRQLTGSYIYHLSIAMGSLKELETQMILSKRLNYLGVKGFNEFFKASSEVGRMLGGLKKSLQEKEKKK